MNRKNFTFLILGVVFVVLFFLMVIFLAPVADYPVTNLTDGWEITTPDTQMSDATLGGLLFKTVRKGDTYILRHILPYETCPAAAVQIKTDHSSIRVFIDEDLVYADGTQYLSGTLMTPGRFHFVELPDDYAGRMLTIELSANEADAFSAVDPVLVGNIQDLYLSYLRTGRLTLVAGLYLAAMGVLLFLVFFYLNRYYGLEPRLLSSALIALLLGIYMISYYKLTGFFCSNYLSNDTAEYISLFFLPFAFVIFLASAQEAGRGGIFYILAGINYAVSAVLLLLYAAGIIVLNRFVPLIHGMILTEGIMIFAIMLVRFLRSRKDTTRRMEWRMSEKIWVIGFFVMLLSAMIDVVRYSVLRYVGVSGKAFSNLNVLTAGAIFFVATLILNFFFYHVEKEYAVDVMNRLSGLAYNDPLTDMANRGKCEQILQDVEKEGGSFVIVSLDVDSLKAINDRYGHAAGDQYLVDMATVLNSAFRDADLIGRMGGDEFLAMLKGNDTKRCEAMLREVEDMLATINREKHPMHYGISYGYATSVETAYGTVKAVYHLADVRMYAMKQYRHRQGMSHA